jgi:hypothetical protein
MSVTEAESWAFEFAANSLRDRMLYQEETLSSVAYNVFDEDIDDRGAVGTRLYLTSPNNTEPAIFVEKARGEFHLVFEFDGEEKYRNDIGREFYEDCRRYFE